MPPSATEEEFSRAGGGRVIAQRDRIRANASDLTLDVEIAPGVHGAWRRADFCLPCPQLERQGHAEARNAPPLRVGERVGKAGQFCLDEIEDHGRSRKCEGAVGATSDGAAKVNQDEICTAPPYLEAERIGPLRVERHRNRGLPHASAQGGLAPEEPIRLQSIHDRRSGLHRQSRQSRHFDLRQRAEAAHKRQQQPFVVETHAGLIGAARVAGGAWRGRRRMRLARAFKRAARMCARARWRLPHASPLSPHPGDETQE